MKYEMNDLYTDRTLERLHRNKRFLDSWLAQKRKQELCEQLELEVRSVNGRNAAKRASKLAQKAKVKRAHYGMRSLLVERDVLVAEFEGRPYNDWESDSEAVTLSNTDRQRILRRDVKNISRVTHENIFGDKKPKRIRQVRNDFIETARAKRRLEIVESMFNLQDRVDLRQTGPQEYACNSIQYRLKANTVGPDKEYRLVGINHGHSITLEWNGEDSKSYVEATKQLRQFQRRYGQNVKSKKKADSYPIKGCPLSPTAIYRTM